MPNWCQNILWVDGDAETLQRFKTAAQIQNEDEAVYCEMHEAGALTAKGKSSVELAELEKDNIAYALKKKFTLFKLVPQPSKDERVYSEDSRCEGGWDWYTWRVMHWGTKWDAADVERVQEKVWSRTRLVYKFNTAWSPPRAAIVTISENFPTLEFVLGYLEADMGFMGKIYFQEGDYVGAVTIEDVQDCAEICLETDEDGEVVDVQIDDPEIEELVEAFKLSFF